MNTLQQWAYQWGIPEVAMADLQAVLDQREAVVAAVRGQGYRYVTLDLEGFRSGNLNG